MRLSYFLAFATAVASCFGAEPAPLQPGTLPRSFVSGGPNCVSVPDWQVHAYNEDFYILRESGCTNYEKPFLYLIFGRDKAILEDTGAGPVQIGPFVMNLIAQWAKRNKREPLPLIVIHSHAHGDHVAGDAQFRNLPNVQFVAASVAEVTKAASIANWPAGLGTIDLGDRIIDVIPEPGHNDVSIALYDRKTGNLMTGDSLYPGRLYFTETDLATYLASAARLVEFVRTHPIAHVLGTHIEQTRTPYVDYPRGTTYQPEEHSLELSRAHIFELYDALAAMNGRAEKVALPDFTLAPSAPRKPRP